LRLFQALAQRRDLAHQRLGVGHFPCPLLPRRCSPERGASLPCYRQEDGQDFTDWPITS
jgi:hypothetical protein